ncbi:hypothetical protein IQ229_10280 [Nostoc cf. edaphicum LEGE 07299]|uniref:Uncharacterized protein n=1 Tax=Nostoc cf. edaphicum LEGE 07299 TaxID=2777974 RepID=A0ABR9TY76_9NOSO|nr:hypothetical protein [Nostoc edaphicum]MBE9105314.1 hypothetical protein [Nostoc cf. edaphicum LEGE 07299]
MSNNSYQGKTLSPILRLLKAPTSAFRQVGVVYSFIQLAVIALLQFWSDIGV